LISFKIFLPAIFGLTFALLPVFPKTAVFSLSNDASIVDDNLVFSQQSYGLLETPPSFSSVSAKEGFFDERTAESNFTIDNFSTPLDSSSPQNQERGGTVVYKVVAGDTLSSIALKYNLEISTILWSNDLSEQTIIRPGDEIKVLPVDGLLHQVKGGEVVSQIANTYQASVDEIIRYNNLDSRALINEGDELIIPNGIKPSPVIRNVSSVVQSSPQYQSPPVSARSYTISSSSGSRNFPYGQCTYYVAQRRYVPWRGNAGAWLENARAYGFSVCYSPGCEPRAGAIVVTKESYWGHVAYVEKVTESSIVVSEMNSPYWGRVTSRTISKHSPIIKGYIY